MGDSSAAGVGVTRLRQSLAVQASRFLSRKLRRPIAWQLAAKSGVDTREALEFLQSTVLRPADVLVTSLGVNDVTTQRSVDQTIEDYQALVDWIVRQTGVETIVINGLPPVGTLPIMPQPLRWYLGQYAQLLDARLREWVQTHGNYCFVPLQYPARPEDFAVDGYHPGPALYCRWAERIAESVAAHLETSRPQKSSKQSTSLDFGQCLPA
ncbi:hypothetical protein AYO41_04795 [Verrucomicrobia bacterium SCGC AG-212-E04]|nr:hypothetical protein AYO41_04795 [Verrucomicrobia bacterium SCGC AG-212-E04]